MADDAGLVLLALLRAQAVALLDGVRRALADGAALPAARPAFTGTALDGHVLAAPSGEAAPPLARQVAGGLRALAVGDRAGLFGWAAEPVPAGGGPRTPDGIAVAARSGGVAAAVAATAPGGRPQLELVASGGADGPALALGGGVWTLTLGVHAAGALRVLLLPEGEPVVLAATPGDAVRVALVRAVPAALGGEPGISLGAVRVTGELVVEAGPRVRSSGRLEVRQGQVRLAPGALARLLPALGPVPLDVDLVAGDGRGLRLAGSPALQVRLPTGASLPGLTTGPLDLGLDIDGDGLRVRASTSVALPLPGAPLRLELRGLGISMSFGLGVGDAERALGLRLPVEGLDPTGAGVAFDTPVVAAAGRIERRPGGDYAGVLAARVPPVSATAFGVLGLDTPPSFAVVLCARFPPPGVQVGLGFSLTGVGGVVAVNRRVDRDGLLAAVADGTMARLLFPSDVGRGADQVLASLGEIFPRAPGRAVVGPMFQLSWGGRLVTASFAVLMELPEPVRLSLLGSLLVAVPSPELPLVRIEATFAGTFDPQVPSFELRATVRGSIVGVALTGDLYALVRGGDEPALVLSAGGFHPRYPLPPGVPPLQRLGLLLAPTPLVELRCQAYVAITSNTLQFGARLELAAEVAGCGLSGHFGFDVLVQREPFRFIADASAGIAVRVFGERLAGVALDLTLEGPAPWRARGRGSVQLFLLEASFDFDETWGAPPPPPLPPPDVGARLAEALRARSSWVSRPPRLSGAPFVLTAAAARRLTDGEILHPQGELAVRQQVVPLGVAIDRFEGIPLRERQRWDVRDPVGGPLAGAAELRDEFAAGRFLALDDDGALGRAAFEPYRAGLGFVVGGVELAEQRDADLTFETKVITGDEPAGSRRDVQVGDLLDAALTVAAAARIDSPLWWQSPPGEQVTVATPPVTLVDTYSLTAAADAPSFATTVEAEQAAAELRSADPLRRVAVAGLWEAQS